MIDESWILPIACGLLFLLVILAIFFGPLEDDE